MKRTMSRAAEMRLVLLAQAHLCADCNKRIANNFLGDGAHAVILGDGSVGSVVCHDCWLAHHGTPKLQLSPNEARAELARLRGAATE